MVGALLLEYTILKQATQYSQRWSNVGIALIQYLAIIETSSPTLLTNYPVHSHLHKWEVDMCNSMSQL